MSFSLRIDNKDFEHFRDFTLNFKYDSVASTFGFTALFDPNNKTHRELFKPASYKKAQVYFGGRLILTGIILNNAFKITSKKEPLTISGYSTPGILQDVTLAVESRPLQFDGMTVLEIVERCCSPYGVNVVVDPTATTEANEVLPNTEIKINQKIKEFLVEITTQKNLMLSHNEKGELVITKSFISKPPIDEFGSGMSSSSVALSINGQGMHSEISTLKQASVDTDNAGEASTNNPYVSTLRTLTVNQSSGDDNDSGKYGRSLLSSELKNISLKIETDRIQWRNGGLMLPNETITVRNNDLYLFKKTKFFVESVTIKGNNASSTASLNCVLPEVYNENEPVNIF